MKPPFVPYKITKSTKYTELPHRRERQARKLEEYERYLKLYGCIPTHKAFENYYYNVEEDKRAVKKK